MNINNFGIFHVDTGYIGGDIASMYLLVQNAQVAIIETGTSNSVAAVEQALIAHNLDFDAVRFIIPTHVHLDHAAGAGVLMQKCPNANLVIHPRGARHMIDPSKLIAGTVAVYGQDKFDELYGQIIPIIEDKIIIAEDNFTLDLEGRELRFIDTPGHARHHFCIWDKMSQSMFTGDTFGISYREFDVADEIFIFPTTTPVQFDPEALIQSIDRIMSFNPNYICLTHFNAIQPNANIANRLKQGVNYFAQIARDYYPNKQKISEKMLEFLLANLNDMGFKDTEFASKKLAGDILLNTKGLLYWQQLINKEN